MSESARGEGGRVWVPKTVGDKRDPNSIPEKDRWYFLEEWYPKYGNLVPRDVPPGRFSKLCMNTTSASTASRWFISISRTLIGLRLTASSKAFWKFTKSLSAMIREKP